MKELSLRVGVAVVGIPLLLFTIFAGGYYFLSLIIVVTLIGQWELAKLLSLKGVYVQKAMAGAAALLIIYQIAYGLIPELLAILILIILFIFGWEMFCNEGSAILNTAGTLLIIVYPAVFLACFLYLRTGLIEQIVAGLSAEWFIVSLFISVWICDTFAYFIGVRFGKHRLFERVSPKKSIEGALAGLAGAILTFLIMKWMEVLNISLIFAVICGLITGIFGQVGDLVESWFKRDAGVKDSSSFLPGHGGILDRFDSLIFIAPFFVILLILWK